MHMKAITKIFFLNEDGEKFFGEGPGRLLRGVEETGSLRASALRMGMAYTKALKILKNAEVALGFPLTKRAVGGEGGGGSRLTDEGRAWLDRYEAYRNACLRENRRLYRDFFPEAQSDAPLHFGCVIMASGLGRRFGGNKLLADFRGKPMIQWILEATEGLFQDRILVTRHADVARIAQEMGVRSILHSLPRRSDAIRLGMEALGDADGCMFCPGDQPLLRRETIAAMLKSAGEDGQVIWRAACGEEPGMPVLFPRWTFAELRSLPAGAGGGFLAKKYPDRVRLVPVRDAYELQDADTPEDLKRLLRY